MISKLIEKNIYENNYRIIIIYISFMDYKILKKYLSFKIFNLLNILPSINISQNI